jgi:hypothetical protein
MSEFMKADKTLEKDLNRATTFEEIRALLENATSRSGIADRDPQTGQFVRRDPLTPAAQTIDDGDQQITRTETIGGKEFNFTGTVLEVEKAIGHAYKVAEAVKTAEPSATVTVHTPRAKTQAERERELFDRTQIDLQFRRGELTTAEYLDRTNAIGEYLAEKGFDVDAAAGKQFEQSWQQATEVFLHDTPEGQTWKGGQKNLELIGNLIQSHGLVNAEDKVAALRTMAAEMRQKGLEFDGDMTPEQVNELTDNATPQEILEAWKERQGGDPATANANFIQIHNRSSSGLFGK